MAITVKHLKVSTVPDAGDDTLVEPSDWNADHTLTGLGTMAEQNANNVAITGGTMSGVTVTGYIPTTEKGAALGVATLDAGGKVPVSELPAAVLGALSYQGTWDASTNTPTLTSSTGTKGYYYVVSVAGNTNLNGITDWLVGDWAVYNGTVWQKVDNTDAGGDVVGPASATDNAIARFDGTTGKLLQNSIVTVSDTGVVTGVIEENFTPITPPTYLEGKVFYDTDAKTLAYYNDNSQMTVNIGQEQIVRVRNQTGATIANGTVVYVNGATGNTPTIAKAIATSFTTSDIIGVTTTEILNNGFGYVTISGLVNGLDTSAFAEGDAVFLSATTAGTYTVTEPTRPNYSIQVGVILRANPSVGTLLVSVQIVSTETQHLIGTVAVDQGGTGQTTYTDGQLLIGNSTGNTLTKSTLTAGTAISVTNGAGAITIANTGVTSAVAGTGISVSGSTGAVTVTNTAPDQTVAIAAGTGISVSGTYPSFTVANTGVTSITGTASQVTASASTGGVTLSLPATINVNTSGSAATLTTGRTIAITGDLTYTSPSFNGSANVTAAGTLATVNANVGSFTNASLTVNAKGLVTAVSSGTAPVTSVTGTSPVVSSGGATPAISLASGYGDTQNPYASKTANNFLAAPNGSAGVPTFRAIVAADIPTLNQNTTGSAATLTTGRTIGMTGDVTWTSGSFNGSANVTGTATLATVSIAKGGTGQTTATAAFNALNPMTTTGDIIYEASPTTAARLGIGSTGQVLTVSGGVPAWAAAPSSNITTQGLYENSATISANYTIGSGNNAMSAGPITISTGVTVTVPTGSTWTVV